MSSRYTPVALLSCDPVVMPRITSRFVLGPVEPKLKPGTNPAKSVKSRALIWSKVLEVRAVMLLGTFWMDSERRVAVTMISASSLLDPPVAAVTACAAAQDAQSDAAVPVSAASIERNEAMYPPIDDRPNQD